MAEPYADNPRDRFDGLMAMKAEIDKRLAPLRNERNKLRDEVAELEAKLRDLNKRVKSAEAAEGVYDIDMKIAQAARDAGARSIKAGGLGQPG